MELRFKVINDHVKADGIKLVPVADSINHLTAVFEFDNAWDGSVKTAIFGNEKNTYHEILKNGENSCIIPWEVLTGERFTVSVFGIRGEERITATELSINLAASGYKNGTATQEPTDSAYTQLLQLLAWNITSKDVLSKFAEGSTEVPGLINIINAEGETETLEDCIRELNEVMGGGVSGEVKYSTTPQKIGTWIDGTPIWRLGFSKSFEEMGSADDIWNNRAIYLESLMDGVLVDSSAMPAIFVTNERLMLMADIPCCLDDVPLPFSMDAWSLTKDCDEEYHTGCYGWIEFACEEANINNG